MNNLVSNCFPSSVLAVLALGVLPGTLLPGTLLGGEAIQFSNARNRQDPTAAPKLGDKAGDKIGRMSPLEFLPPSGGESTRRDPQRDRKAKNAAAERKYWMVLEKGQLDAQDEEKRASGMRDVSFEKESDRKDYFFAPLGDKEDGSGRPRSPFSRPLGRDHSESDVEPKEIPGNGAKGEDNSDARRTQVLGKDGKPMGEHTAKELDLRDVLSTGKANSLAPSLAPGADKTALMWQAALGGSGDPGPGRRRDEATAADSFRGPLPGGPSKSGDAFNFRNDLNTRAATPIPSAVADSGARRFNLPTAPMAPRATDPGFSRSAGIYSSPTAGDPYGSSPYGSSAGGVGADPYRSQPSQPSRSSSSSFQIPSRPGYGGR